MIRATGRAGLAGSSNLTVTVAAGWPAASRRLLATEGGGGCISIWSARWRARRAGRPGSARARRRSSREPARCQAAPAGSWRRRRRGSPPTVHTQRMTSTAHRGPARAPARCPPAARRLDTCRLLHASSPPIGSTCEVRPDMPSSGSRYSAGLARYTCPSGSRRSRCRAASSSIAASTSAALTL